MRLADGGEVLGHFIVPYIDDEKVREALNKALALTPHRDQSIQKVQLVSVAGECDLMLHLSMNDFRVVADLQAAISDSYSFASSWLYAVPYQDAEDTPDPAGSVEFFIYLRVHRHFYVAYGTAGERALYRSVRDLLRKAGGDDLSGRVLYSLGWPDLIVHGRLSGDVQNLRRLILSLQALSFPAGGSNEPQVKTPVFLKTITVIGTPMPLVGPLATPLPAGVPATSVPPPVLFGRSRPGLIAEAVGTVREVFERGGVKDVKAWAVNGTWDFVVTSQLDEPVLLEQFHAVIRESRHRFADQGVERTQTHLLTSREGDLSPDGHAAPELVPQAGRPSLPLRCRCANEDFGTVRRLLAAEEALGHVSRGLTRTISHVLSMFRHTLRDSSNCCDSAGSLHAHAQGLEVLLQLLARQHRLLDNPRLTNPRQQALIADEISHVKDHLAEWCKRAGRVVREKTAGSAARHLPTGRQHRGAARRHPENPHDRRAHHGGFLRPVTAVAATSSRRQHPAQLRCHY